ncbi:MAG: HAD family hydrolase [Proteobacteria bacterium]|nr:HAD family hydrolase [Pseudomonadota bacterium]
MSERPDVPARDRRSHDLVIIDLDGTLVDSFGDIERALTHAFQAIDVSPDAGVLALCRRGLPLEAYYQHALLRDPEAAGERDRMDRFVAAYRDYYGRYQHSTAVYPGVVDTLSALRQKWPDVVLAIGTSKRTDIARAVVERAGLSAYFELVQGSENVAKKPDPQLLFLIAQTVGVSLSRAAMVGDTGADVLAARAAGTTAIAVTYGGFDRPELEAAGPDHLIDEFSQLLGLL